MMTNSYKYIIKVVEVSFTGAGSKGWQVSTLSIFIDSTLSSDTLMFPPSNELRQHPRHKPFNTFIVSKQGVYKVFDVSKGGMSFGCIDRRDLPQELIVDIVDDQGFHLPDLPVAQVWCANNEGLTTDRIYQTVVGAKFSIDLTEEQQTTLNQLLI